VPAPGESEQLALDVELDLVRGGVPDSAGRPTVLDVRTSPDVPPIPPHATFEQFKDLASALVHGDENRWDVIREGIKTMVQEFLPHARD
jgi:pyruvate dehydrogenase (quinone)